MNINQEQKFILELNELSKKYGLYIDGCGCCGSPRLEHMNSNELSELSGYGFQERTSSEIQYISEGNYDWKKGCRPLHLRIYEDK